MSSQQPDVQQEEVLVSVLAAQGDRAVNVEEVTCQQRGRLRVQELPPGGAAALRRGRDPQTLQYAPHCGSHDPEPETEQFALDPLDPPVAPARFSRAICSISTAIWGSTGGLPPREG
jgi:hypothetical protein